MTIPNIQNVYTPSKVLLQKTVSRQEFLLKYAEHPREIKVCFVETDSPEVLVKNTQRVTAYNPGMSCWYMVVG